MRPINVKQVRVTDPFWRRLQELVRREMLPYQWAALNDSVDGAEKSLCMHNFRAAARLNERRRTGGEGFAEPAYSDPGFENWPGPGEEPDPDRFYGFVFQDTDLYKWLEAAAYSLTVCPDPSLETLADGAIDLICRAQNESGYLDTYYILNGMDRALTNLKDHHELYCLGHLLEAAVAYHEATGKDKLLNAARRFADLAYEKLGPEGEKPGYPGHEIAEMALVRLYEATGEEKYLALSRLFLDRRGGEPHLFDGERRAGALRKGSAFQPDADPGRYAYYQAHRPVREQDEAVGHAVRAVYLCSGMADVARLTGDEGLRAACLRLWGSIVGEKLYITGGVGGTHLGEAFSYPFDLPNDAAYSETCAAVGLVFFARRMLALEPRGEYADVMERALYNTVLAGMALDGQSFFYVNPLEVVPDACRRDGRLSHVKPTRQKWFGCACCPPNVARLLVSVAAYAYTENEDTLWVNLYIGGEMEKTVGGKSLRLSVNTDMPWAGHVTVRIGTEEAVTAALALRIPGWTDRETMTASVPGDKRREERDGYLYLTGSWADGETVELTFPMPVRVVTADPRVRECTGKAAVVRGPLVYCAEEADNGPALHLYRLDTDRLDGIAAGTEDVQGQSMRVLDAPAKRLHAASGPLYVPYSPPQEEPASLRLIPYFAWANRGEGEMRVWLRI